MEAIISRGNGQIRYAARVRRCFDTFVGAPRVWSTTTSESALVRHRMPLQRSFFPPSTLVRYGDGSAGSVRWFSSVKAQKIPPNLFIDPLSNFAPVKKSDLVGHFADEDDEGEDDDLDISGSEQDYDDDDDDALFIPPKNVTYVVPLPERLHVPVHSLFVPKTESQVGTLWLHELAFGRESIRVDLLKRAVNYVRNKKRGKRTVKVKTVSEVRGSGRKLRPQKGTGRARVGHGRPPHFRGGARTHGPRGLTDYGKTKLNKKVRRLALSHALSQKLMEGNLIVVNQLYDLPTPKTRALARYLEAWGLGGKRGKTAFIVDVYRPKPGEEVHNDDGPIQSHRSCPVNFWCASSNIPNILFGNVRSMNVYRILRHEKLILTLAAVEALEHRLKHYD